MSEIKKYIAAPVTVEAVLLLDSNDVIVEDAGVGAWEKHVEVLGDFFGDIPWTGDDQGVYFSNASATEQSFAKAGQWLVKGIDGEVSVISAETFAKAYHAVANNVVTYQDAFDLLVEAAQTFRRYEQNHRDKNTPDSLTKAEVNADIAGRIEKALTGG